MEVMGIYVWQCMAVYIYIYIYIYTYNDYNYIIIQLYISKRDVNT